MSLPPLQPEQRIKPHSFELRMSVLFTLIFLPLGVHLPYIPLWLEAQGLDAQQIAIVLSVPMFLRLITTPLISAMADRASDRAYVMIALVAATLVASLGYFLTPTYLTILAVSVILHIFWSSHAPLSDSLALSGVRRFGSSYPRMRIWGSISFLCGNLFGGLILGATSPAAVPWMISIGLAGGLVASLLAPRLGRPRRASPLSAADLHSAAPKLINRTFVLILAGTGLILGSHGYLYSFSSIYWKSLGIGDATIGLLWAWSVGAEVGLYMVYTKLFGRRSTATVLILSGIGAVVRWAAFPLVEPLGFGVGGFFVLQTLHALSTAAAMIGLQKLIADTIAEERTGAAQGMAFFANGIGMAVITLLSGPLYNRFGADGFYVMTAVALAGIGLIMAARSAPEGRLRR